MLDRLLPTIDGFLPPWMHEGGPDVLRRGRTAITIAWLMGTMFGAVLVMRLAAAEWRSAAFDVGLVAACFGAPFLVKWTGRYTLVGNLMLAGVFGLLVVLGGTNANPGLNAATVALAEIPLFAFMLFGVRLGYAWSVACAAAVLAIGMSHFDVLWAPTPDERAAFNEYWAVLIMCLTLVSAGRFYEYGKDASLARIQELEQSKRQAEIKAVRGQSEAQLEHAQRFASMGRLAASVAHEINNPLTYVVCNLNYMRDTADGSETKELVDETLEGVDRIRRIVTDLQSSTRPASKAAYDADVSRAAERAAAVAETASRTKAEVELDLEPELRARCEEARLEQVLLNLIVNAVQALPDGEKDQHRVIVRSFRELEFVVVEVEDNGPGIPPELLERVREPFFTTKPVGEGTGLGLALADSIVRGYGGSLGIDSVPGRTVVRVSIPARGRTIEPPKLVESRPRAPAYGQTGLRILVCDDDDMVARAIARHLKAHEVDIVNGGRAALERLAAGEEYDMILCDLMMPDVAGMDVWEAVVDRFPDHAGRMVFMSGGAVGARAQSFRQGSGVPFMPKPIAFEDLQRHVQAAEARIEDAENA